jgi:hypothetical protein
MFFVRYFFRAKKRPRKCEAKGEINKIENDKVTSPGNSDNTVSLLEKRD